MKYDYFVAGRWRNHTAIREVVEKIRETGKTAYCFLENEYDGDGIKFENNPSADAEAMMKATEQLTDWQTNQTFRKIFETDMQAQRDAEAFVLVFPAGLAAHVELGTAYGMGKKCYGVGTPEKAETLYLAFDAMYPDAESFIAAQIKVEVAS